MRRFVPVESAEDMIMSAYTIERYLRTREKLKLARMRPNMESEDERLQDELDALWIGMSDADRRTVKGVGERKRAAA